MKRYFGYIIAAAVLLVIAGTLFFFNYNKNKKSDEQILRIGIPNISPSAPLWVMNELDLMNKYLPNSRLELIINGSGSALNEAMIANQIDGVVIDLINFLIGISRNVPYRILTSMSYRCMSLQTNNPGIKNIYDVRSNHLIGLNSTTGTVALMLHLTAEKFFGSYDALNSQIVVINNDDISLALANNVGISLAFTDSTTRILQNELGCPTILEDTDLFEGHLFTHYVVFNEEFHAKNKELINAFFLSLTEAVKLINSKDYRALEIVSKNLGTDKDKFIALLDTDKLIYELNNFDSIDILTDMAKKIGLISTRKPLDQIVFKNE